MRTGAYALAAGGIGNHPRHENVNLVLEHFPQESANAKKLSCAKDHCDLMASCMLEQNA